jgi:hypothetical protein
LAVFTITCEGQPVVATTVLKTEGMYLGIFDRASPANSPGRFRRTLEEAQRLAGRQGWKGIPHFNKLWGDLARAGAVLAWVLVFDGVFRIRLEVLPPRSADTPGAGDVGTFLGTAGPSASLLCPSGEIVVAPLLQLGDASLRPLVTVTPGLYAASIRGNTKEEAKHEFLDDVDEYPAADGPDWELTLQHTGAVPP